MTTPIPSPAGGYLPFLGHAYLVNESHSVVTFREWAKECGEIYSVWMLTRPIIMINSAELCADVSNDQKFTKSVAGSLGQVRVLVGDALFTAEKGEVNWGIAHRLLMPKFRTSDIKKMFPDMLDITTQLILKWERFGPEHRLNPTEDFTRLTLDTIALCSMSYRLNSFYREDNHPFVQAMYEFLTECGLRSKRPAIVQYFMGGRQEKWEQNMKCMMDLATGILQNRRKHPVDKDDLLNVMLRHKDPKTRESLPDDTIVKNLITFLIAGHETTSGTLAFCVYFLIKNPDAMRKAQTEVDEVLGDQHIQPEDLSCFPYLTAVMRESLRLGPTIPWRQVYANEDTTIGDGKYFIPKGQRLIIHTEKVHTDRRVWGDDADEFKPERMLDGKFEALPPGSWQPFGQGARVCIGRPFATQEVLLALAMILQKFDLQLADSLYGLEIAQTLTIKPANFFIHALPRHAANSLR